MLNEMAQGGTFDGGPVVYYALPSGSWVSYLPRMSCLTTISWSWTAGRRTGGELARQLQGRDGTLTHRL